MADPREDEEILLNMIRGSAEEGRYDDREGNENPEGSGGCRMKMKGGLKQWRC
jgi:hypothetical protein